MRKLSITGLVLAGIYATLSSAALACSHFQCLGHDPGCFCGFCDLHMALALMPVLPASYGSDLLGFGFWSLMRTLPGYLSTIFATAVALYALVWLIGKSVAALRPR
jgi:hypothetical protein